jgi:hypothetical protein
MTTTNPMAADNDSDSGIELLDTNGHQRSPENGFPFARASEPRPTKRRCILACLAAGALIAVALLALPRDDPRSLQQTLESIDATLGLMATVGAALAGTALPTAETDLCAVINGTNATNATWADVYVDYKEDELFLIIPDAALGKPFTVIATTRRVTGEDAGLAHYGAGAGAGRCRLGARRECCLDASGRAKDDDKVLVRPVMILDARRGERRRLGARRGSHSQTA